MLCGIYTKRFLLRRICYEIHFQGHNVISDKEKEQPQFAVGSVMGQKASFPVTYVFINTGRSANMVSAPFIVIFVAAVLLSVNNFGCMLAGVILTNFWLVLDCVDGNIARVKKTKTFMGDFFDAVAGYGPFSFTTVALGVAAFHTSFLVPEKYRYLLILLGGIGAVANIYSARFIKNI